MKVKGIIDEDFVNYKKPSMFIATSKCDFKCDKEAGCQVCQNSDLANSPTIEINDDDIIKRYLDNPITEAIVIGGLEPFDDINELFEFISDFRQYSKDDIVIYTGYYPEDIPSYIDRFQQNFKNIIIKFGRFIPNQKSHYDTVLGVDLASDNQEAFRLEDLM